MRIMPRPLFCLGATFAVLLLLLEPLSAQSLAPGQARLNTGISLFSQGKYSEAIAELRRAQAEASQRELRAEALYWISLSALAMGEYAGALRDMDTLLETDSQHYRAAELPYHRGRCLYYLGRYDEAVISFKGYADSIVSYQGRPLSSEDVARKAAALYWTGECLFIMGQLDRAGDMYSIVTEDYPSSPKYEASVYRLALINQKKVENELLGLLRWSHEESLRNMEDFRRKEITYDQALSAYQRRLNDLTSQTEMTDEQRMAELEEENAVYRNRLESAEERIRLLESLSPSYSAPETDMGTGALEKLMDIRASALELEKVIGGGGL